MPVVSTNVATIIRGDASAVDDDTEDDKSDYSNHLDHTENKFNCLEVFVSPLTLDSLRFSTNLHHIRALRTPGPRPGASGRRQSIHRY